MNVNDAKLCRQADFPSRTRETHAQTKQQGGWCLCSRTQFGEASRFGKRMQFFDETIDRAPPRIVARLFRNTTLFRSLMHSSQDTRHFTRYYCMTSQEHGTSQITVAWLLRHMALLTQTKVLLHNFLETQHFPGYCCTTSKKRDTSHVIATGHLRYIAILWLVLHDLSETLLF